MLAAAATVISTKGSAFSVVDLANLAVAVAFIIAGALSVFYIFVGGISFILSAGQEDKIKQAVHTIRYAIIGLIVTFLAISIIAIVGNILDINLVSYLNWDKIMQLIDKIIGSFYRTGAGPGGTLR